MEKEMYENAEPYQDEKAMDLMEQWKNKLDDVESGRIRIFDYVDWCKKHDLSLF